MKRSCKDRNSDDIFDDIVCSCARKNSTNGKVRLGPAECVIVVVRVVTGSCNYDRSGGYFEEKEEQQDKGETALAYLFTHLGNNEQLRTRLPTTAAEVRAHYSCCR